MYSLSERLALAASFVKKGSSVCDVGTDHGYLPVFLHKSGRCKYICATEINKKPYLNAKATFKSENADIKLYLCDGLDFVPQKDIDTVIITGMGGDVISGIIDRAPLLKRKGVSFILQPMTAASVLREYLAQNGYVIKDEQAVKDGGRLYSVICAEYNGRPYKLSPSGGRIGAVKPLTADNIAYIKRQKVLCEDLCERLEKVSEKADLLQKEREALKEINRILGEYNAL